MEFAVKEEFKDFEVKMDMSDANFTAVCFQNRLLVRTIIHKPTIMWRIKIIRDGSSFRLLAQVIVKRRE